MEPIAVWLKEDIYRDFTAGKALTIILKTSGCSYRRCVFCSYYLDASEKQPTPEELINQFEKALSKYNLKDLDTFSVKIFTSGSFLDDNEVYKEVREYIYKRLSEFENLKELSIESRAEFITEKKLKEIREYLDINVEIGLGVETANEKLRQLLNKNLSNKQIEEVVKLANKYNIGIKAYLLIKPPFLTERLAIEDAIKSAEYCIKIGCSRVSFCPVTIHKNTILEYLWRKKQYRPAYIWSIREILTKIKKDYPNYLVMVDTSGLGTKRGPYNCEKCNKDFKTAIERYNITQNIDYLNINCECKKFWEIFKKKEIIPIQESYLLEPLHSI